MLFQTVKTAKAVPTKPVMDAEALFEDVKNNPWTIYTITEAEVSTFRIACYKLGYSLHRKKAAEGCSTLWLTLKRER